MKPISNVLIMKKITLFITLFILSIGFYQSQMTTHTKASLGYTYQNQSFAEVGAKFLFLNNDDFLYRLGGSAMLGSTNNKLAIMPKIQADILINTQKNVDISHSYYFLAGVESTTKYIAPKLGISLFGLVDFSGGYAFSLDKKGLNGKELKGLNLNLSFNIPLVVFEK